MAGQPVRQRIVVPFAGHVIGQGVNSDAAERVGTGLTAASIGEDPAAPGQTAVFKFQMLTSQSSLESALNIGAELEARYALFSGGAKFDFAESNAMNSTSTYIVASCIVTNARRSGSGFSPTPAAQQLIAAADLDGFKTAFGDRFTETLHTGGEFYTLVRVTSSNAVHQRRISASLHAEYNGLAFGASFQASLEQAVKDTSSHTEVVVQVHQSSGVGPAVQIPGIEADKIRAHMNRFADAAHQKAVAYQAELVTYDTLALDFPRPEELEDRRQVLEDCLVLRQRLWSVINDLRFAQGEDAELIFEDLPTPETLAELETAFTRILGDLMAHARGVSSGAIAPVPFAVDGPPIPRFKRRQASRFATWWAKRESPDLLKNERILIGRIGREVGFLLDVPIASASPETMERASETLTSFAFGAETFGEREVPDLVTSIAILPEMLDAPLKNLHAGGTELRDLDGIEAYPRLETVSISGGQLRDLGALVATPGVRSLTIRRNKIEDLSPIRALTALERLDLRGNQIETLEPLRELRSLSRVTLAGVPGGGVFIDNPLTDARALAALPQLATALAVLDRARLTLVGPTGDLVDQGIATRVGDTNRFDFTSASTGTTDRVQVLGFGVCRDLDLFDLPVVVTGLHFRDQDLIGASCTKPGDLSRTFTGPEIAKLFDRNATQNDTVRDEFGLISIKRPRLLAEVVPA